MIREDRSMTRIPQGKKLRGSQRWIQDLVNSYQEVLDEAIGIGKIHWRSPLADDDYAEYRDDRGLDRIDVQLRHRSLESFWPKRGPQWDALGRTESGEAILVEAKAHIGELFSGATKATDASARKIRASLREVMTGLHAKPGLDWSTRFYQYTNRLAHGYLLSKLNKVPCRLVFLYLIGDTEMKGPDTKAEWEAAIRVLHEALGLPRSPARFVAEVFVDVRGPSPRTV
jgi:hypothetical protein